MSEFPWWRLVERTGEAGSKWAHEFQSTVYARITTKIDGALILLRRHDIKSGYSELQRAERLLEKVEDEDFLHVIRRFLFGVQAYHYYLRREPEKSRVHLQWAHNSVCLALSRCDFLLPLTDQCLDFRHQRIRIARWEQNWEEMEAELVAVKAVLDGNAPFCRTTKGKEIYLSDLQGCYKQMDLSPEEYESVRYLFDTDLRNANFRHLAESLYTLPDLVICL